MPKFTVYKGGKGGKVTKSETSKPDLKGDEVLLRVTASGLCGTDLHYREQYVALRTI
jgi:threonine dehydrogenase-like Zn-dependent dehydrogenase